MAKDEQALKELLKNSSAKGAKASENIDGILNSLNTAENRKFLKNAGNNPIAEKAAAGDAEAMSAFMKELLGSSDGKNFINQVKKQIDKK